jgi:predicted amidohydrolase
MYSNKYKEESMKDQLIVSAVQMSTKWLDVEENVNYIKSSITKIKEEENADLIVFPELSNTGYIKERDKVFGRKFTKMADTIPGRITDDLGKQAKKYGVYVVIGLAELHPEIPGTLYNSAVLIDPKGEIVGVQHKMHIPGEEKHYFISGTNCNTYKTDIGNIGMSICYDGRFPEFTRILALKGAEILCMIWNMPSFAHSPELLEHITATRAAENKMFVVSCNRVGIDGKTDFFGHSVISDPVGNFLAKAGKEKTIITATLKEEVLLEERLQQPVFRDRRPEMYSYLLKNM